MKKNIEKRVNKTRLTIFLGGIIITVIILTTIFAYQTMPKKCHDIACFQVRAEQCLPTTMEITEDDLIVTSRITSECSIISTFEYINEQGKRELDSKKTCFYEKNKYIETLIESDVFPCVTE